MHWREGSSTLRATTRRRAAVVLTVGCLGCASGGGKSSPPPIPEFVKAAAPCWVGGRITLDPSLLPTSPQDELATLTCDNLVLVQKSEDGSTKVIHADGNFAAGYGECHYQFIDVPAGTSTYSGRVVALSVPESRYAMSSAVEFNAVRCGGSVASLNQRLDFTLSIPDVRGR
ncbi:MAG TPA: hypothetical protein VEJ89_14390 [Myxococcaceae bacterium]|nr:hypothetical protein [Myxococcaceae bacterium]